MSIDKDVVSEMNNSFAKLPASPDPHETISKARHYVLGIDKTSTAGIAFNFFEVKNVTLPNGIFAYVESQVEKYRFSDLEVSKNSTKLSASKKIRFIDKTPFDLPVSEVCYVIIQLAKGMNWQFVRGGAGLTTKHDYEGDNCDLYHVWKDKSTSDVIIRADESMSDECRMIFFKVRRRRAREGQQVNLHLEFTQGEQRLSMIADPDIKNEGNTPFP